LLGLALLVGLALVAFVWRRSRSIHRESIEEEAEAARESLIPEVSGGSASAAGLNGYGAVDEARGRRM
jgi:hypothetical protein